MSNSRLRFFAASGAVWFEGHTNYVFIYDTESGLCVMNTGNPGLVGKDVRELKDAAGLERVRPRRCRHPFAPYPVDDSTN